MTAPRPYNLIAELTYRCPLRCPYCSNPVGYASVRDGLDGEDWSRVFAEAAELGCVHAGLTGGEPALHRDLERIVAGAAAARLYPHLVTSGVGLDAAGIAALVRAGLRSVQLSVQDSGAEDSDALAGTACFDTKLAFAEAVREQGLPLTLNVVLHRHNLERLPQIVKLALDMGATRLELANVQIHGWAAHNAAALLPTGAQLEAAAEATRQLQKEHPEIEMLFVLPDHHRGRPKPCMGGWGSRAMVVAPDGSVLPCHGAAELPGLEFWNARERPLGECWSDAPGMNAFRGEGWMRAPCSDCPERDRDFGGCRCQAFRLAGDAAATDPACSLSPHHEAILALRRGAEAPAPPLILRGQPT